MGDFVDIAAADGHRLSAYVAAPAGKPRGGLVVIQTAYGVDDYLRGVCDSYARDGYLSLAPALYDRQRRDAVFSHDAAGGSAAQAMRRGLVWVDVLRDVDAARAKAASAGRVGIVGFCVGGSVVWLAAQKMSFVAAASYYGKDVVDFLSQPPACPTILHFGDRDHLIPLDDIEKIRTAFPGIPNYLYPAGHGFDAHEPESARLARARTLEHFRAHIG